MDSTLTKEGYFLHNRNERIKYTEELQNLGFVYWEIAKALGVSPATIQKDIGVLKKEKDTIIKTRFGIDQEKPKTLDEIGNEIKKHKERVRQIELLALEKLRHPNRSKHLRCLVDPLNTTLTKQLEFEKKLVAQKNNLELEITKLKEFENTARQIMQGKISDKTKLDFLDDLNNNDTVELLIISIDEIDISVRTYNCLIESNIRYIGDLVQKSEEDLLKTRNFGRKCLGEVKIMLEEMGLKLGTVLNETMKQKLGEALKNKIVEKKEEKN